MTDDELWDALDGLHAYDVGATRPPAWAEARARQRGMADEDVAGFVQWIADMRTP
jgi:hypothetical protein